MDDLAKKLYLEDEERAEVEQLLKDLFEQLGPGRYSVGLCDPNGGSGWSFSLGFATEEEEVIN